MLPASVMTQVTQISFCWSLSIFFRLVLKPIYKIEKDVTLRLEALESEEQKEEAMERLIKAEIAEKRDEARLTLAIVRNLSDPEIETELGEDQLNKAAKAQQEFLFYSRK